MRGQAEAAAVVVKEGLDAPGHERPDLWIHGDPRARSWAVHDALVFLTADGDGRDEGRGRRLVASALA